MRKLLSIIAVCLLAGAARAATYSLPVTFSGYTKTETLTNFPALVKFTNSISGFAYSQFASTNGYDLRFTNSAGTTELNYEIESWNTNGESCVWVQVPLLTNGFTRAPTPMLWAANHPAGISSTNRAGSLL